MPRIRTVKPEFWQNEELASLPPETRLLAIGLLNHADDEGYFNANIRLLKALIFPFDDIGLSVQDMLFALYKIDYVRLATGIDSKPYGLVTNFVKHQKVNRPSPSKISDLGQFTEYSLNAHGVLSESSLPERKGKEEERNRERKGNTVTSGDVGVVFNHWRDVMKKPQSILTPKREKAVNNILKLGYSVDQIKLAIDNCKRSPFHQGQNTRRTVYDDLELICRDGEHVEAFLNNINQGAGVETIEQFQDRATAQAQRVAAFLAETQA